MPSSLLAPCRFLGEARDTLAAGQAVEYIVDVQVPFLQGDEGVEEEIRRLVEDGLALAILGGVLFAYFVVFPNAFRFFLSFSGTDITAMPKVDNYLSLIVKFSLAFGLAFQIPVLIVVLVRVGILQIDTLRRGRRYAFLICAVAAAILSPPDVMSMVLLLIPMYLLFEIGLFFAARVAPRPWAEEGKAAGVDSAQETDTAAAMDAAEASFHRDEQRPSDREP